MCQSVIGDTEVHSIPMFVETIWKRRQPNPTRVRIIKDMKTPILLSPDLC